MAKIQKHIEIVRSDIGLSSLSRASAVAIYRVLAKHYHTVHISHINSHAELAELKDLQPDLVFLGVKYVPEHAHLGKADPNKLWVAEYLDHQSIRYTGSPSQAARLDLDKSLAKRQIQKSGLNTSRFFITNPDSLPSSAQMPFAYPVFIKPPRMGGGAGVDKHSVVHTYTEFYTKVSSIAVNHGTDSLVEEYLTGREFSVAVLMSEKTGELQAMPIELIAQANERGDRMLSSVVKTSNAESVRSVDDGELRSAVCQLALDAFKALGGRDYGRIDIRLNHAGVPQFLEANLIPSIIDGYGSFPKACQINLGLDYESMVLQIVRLGFAHHLSNSAQRLVTTVRGTKQPAIAPNVSIPSYNLN